MSEQNDLHESDEDLLPPPSEGISAPRREKPKKGFKVTQGKVFIGTLGVMVLVAGYTLLSGDNEDAVHAPRGTTPVEGTEGLRMRESPIELEEFQRDTPGQGGLGQERAEVLAEIDEREALQERIESGRSAIRFGDPFDEDEGATEPPPPARNVFGDVTPREPAPAQPSRHSPNVLPISGNTAHPMGGAPAQGAGQNLAGIQHELGLAEGAAAGHLNIAYYEPSESGGYGLGGSGGSRNMPHPLTPDLSRTGAAYGDSGSGGKVETLALPGDRVLAYMSNRVSSDQPSGRVLIDILEGPLKGGRMLGVAGFEGERLLINFDQLVYEGEVIEGVQAVAIDTETLDTSVQDGINRRLFLRYGVPVLTGIAGLGLDYEANRNNPSVTETNLHTGELVSRRSNQSDSFGEYALTQAASDLKAPLQSIASRAAATPIEVWAEPGIIGLMFVTRVER